MLASGVRCSLVDTQYYEFLVSAAGSLSKRTCSPLLLHNRSAVPHHNLLVPSCTRAPPLSSKQAPVHASHKLCVSSHSSHFSSTSIEHGILQHILLLQRPHTHSTAIRPHPTRHVITRTQQDIRQMRRPRQLPHRVFMPWQYRDRSMIRHPNIKRPYDTIHSSRRNNRVAVFIPIMRQRFRRRYAHGRRNPHPRLRRRMYGHTHRKVITRASWRPQIKHPQVTIRAHAAQHTRTMRTKRRRVRARMRRQRSNTRTRIRVPDLNRAVPAAGQERVFGNEVPGHAEDFARVLGPGLHGELGQRDVEEFDGAVAAGGEDLVLVRFGPGAVEEGVLRVEPGSVVSM
jgi:hypothetical protein